MNRRGHVYSRVQRNYTAWIARGTGGVARVTVDGVLETVTLPGGDETRRIVFSRTGLPVGAHNVTIEVVSGTVSIDGLVIR